MQGNYFLCKPEFKQEHLDQYVKERVGKLLLEGKVAAVKVEEYKSPRSLSANALFWLWMESLAKLFHGKGMKIEYYHEDGALKGVRDYDKNDMHDLMVDMFLPREKKKLSRTVLDVPASTSRLNASEFCHFMDQINHWSVEKLNHILPDPAESEYRKYLELQNR